MVDVRGVERQSERFAHLDERFLADAESRREAAVPDEAVLADLLAGKRITPGMMAPE